MSYLKQLDKFNKGYEKTKERTGFKTSSNIQFIIIPIENDF